MLDLWLSAKSKLRQGAEIDSRRGPDLHPSQCIVHRNKSTPPTPGPADCSALLRPPSGSGQLLPGLSGGTESWLVVIFFLPNAGVVGDHLRTLPHGSAVFTFRKKS